MSKFLWNSYYVVHPGLGGTAPPSRKREFQIKAKRGALKGCRPCCWNSNCVQGADFPFTALASLTAMWKGVILRRRLQGRCPRSLVPVHSSAGSPSTPEGGMA